MWLGSQHIHCYCMVYVVFLGLITASITLQGHRCVLWDCSSDLPDMVHLCLALLTVCQAGSVGSRCFFTGLNRSAARPPEPRWVRLPVCLRGTRLPQVAHMSSASRLYSTGSVIDPHQMLTGTKTCPLAALVQLCASTPALILPPARCNPQDVAPRLSTVRTGSS